MRLIDADKLKDIISDTWVLDRIDEQPTIEAEPTRHGHWKVVDEAEPRRYGCSRCKVLSYDNTNYCPRCGAKMDLEEERNDT